MMKLDASRTDITISAPCQKPQCVTFKPKEFRTHSASRSTATLTWVRNNLPARGAQWNFFVDSRVRRAERLHEVTIYRYSMIVELTPSSK